MCSSDFFASVSTQQPSGPDTPNFDSSASVRMRSALVWMASTAASRAAIGRDAEFFRAGFVHERGVQVAHLLAFRAGGIVLGRGAALDDLAEVVFGLFRQDGENPVVGAVGGDLGLGKPRAVHGAKQIVLGADGLVEIRLVNAAGQRGGSRRRRSRLQASPPQADRIGCATPQRWIRPTESPVRRSGMSIKSCRLTICGGSLRVLLTGVGRGLPITVANP